MPIEYIFYAGQKLNAKIAKVLPALIFLLEENLSLFQLIGVGIGVPLSQNHLLV